jgi:hypothetical protein
MGGTDKKYIESIKEWIKKEYPSFTEDEVNFACEIYLNGIEVGKCQGDRNGLTKTLEYISKNASPVIDEEGKPTMGFLIRDIEDTWDFEQEILKT